MSAMFTVEFLNALCTSVGHLVVNWTFVEQSLDMCIATVYQAAGGKHLADELPRGIKRKAKFLKRAFKSIDALKPYAAEIAPLVIRARELSQTRHTVVHGVPQHYDETTTTITFGMLDSTGQMHREELRKLRFQEIHSAGYECESLAPKVLGFVDRLTKALMPQNVINDPAASIPK